MVGGPRPSPGDPSPGNPTGRPTPPQADPRGGFRDRRTDLTPPPPGSNWSPAPASIGRNRDYRAPGTPGGRRFASTEHLAPEAVAAFVDGELGMNAHMRAAQHLSACPECVAAVDAQVAARARLRTSGHLAIPPSLLGQLTQIPTREIDMSAALAEDRPTDIGADDAVFPAANSRPVGANLRGRMNRWRGR